MFDVGDIVKIQPHDETMCFPKSPALNMKGTICRIKSVELVNKYMPDYTYNLEIIEEHFKDRSLIYGGEEDMSWKDRHLVLVKPIRSIEEADVMNLFSEA